MLPTTFEQVNKVFGKPDNMTDEECMSLPVYQGKYSDGWPCIISCWKFSKEDIEEIQRTGCIWLSITGNSMPPVSLYTENPFEQK